MAKKYQPMDNTIKSRHARRERELEMMKMRREKDALTGRIYSLAEIGKKFRVSRARVHQILAHARMMDRIADEGAELTPVISGGEVLSREMLTGQHAHKHTRTREVKDG